MSEQAEPVTVVVADDQSAVREGLVLLLGTLPGITVAGQAHDGDAAAAAVAAAQPQVVLMDLTMPGCDGVEATRRIRASHPGTQVVVLTTYADDDLIIKALQAGAIGYLTKDATRADRPGHPRRRRRPGRPRPRGPAAAARGRCPGPSPRAPATQRRRPDPTRGRRAPQRGVFPALLGPRNPATVPGPPESSARLPRTPRRTPWSARACRSRPLLLPPC